MNAFIEKLLDRAKKTGFSDAEVYVLEKESFEAMATQQEITQYSANHTKGLCFRGMLDGHLGYASTEAFDDQAIDQLIQGAMDSARLCEDTDEAFLYEGKDTLEELQLFHPALEKVTPEEKLRFVLELEQAAKDYDPRIDKVGYTTVFTSSGRVRIVNTRGMDREYQQNGCGAYLQPIAHEGDSTTTGFEVSMKPDFGGLDAKELAASAAKIAVDGLHAKPIPSGSYRVIFQNTAMADLLGVFSDVFSAENAQKGLSLLKGKVGETIANPCVTIVDDPLMENGIGSRPFDAEGVASRKHVVVEQGRFLTFLHNLKTAHKDGVRSTGNASKAGYSGTVVVSPSNFYLMPGHKALPEMMAEARNGLLITEVSGLHAGANAISGDFSLLSKGFVIEEGKRAKPVEQITVAGNFFDMLKNVRGIGADLRFPQGSIGSPSVDAGELSVGGI